MGTTRRKILWSLAGIAGFGIAEKFGITDQYGKLIQNSDAVNNPIVDVDKIIARENIIDDIVTYEKEVIKKPHEKILRAADPTKKQLFLLSNNADQTVEFIGKKNAVYIMNTDLGHKTIRSNKKTFFGVPENKLYLDSRILAMYSKSVVQKQSDGSLDLLLLGDKEYPNKDTPSIRIENQFGMGGTIDTFGIVMPDGSVKKMNEFKLDSLEMWQAALNEAIGTSIATNKKDISLGGKDATHNKTNTLQELLEGINKKLKELANTLKVAREEQAKIAAEKTTITESAGTTKPEILPEEQALIDFNADKKAAIEKQIAADAAHNENTAAIAYVAMVQSATHVGRVEAEKKLAGKSAPTGEVKKTSPFVGNAQTPAAPAPAVTAAQPTPPTAPPTGAVERLNEQKGSAASQGPAK